MSGKRTKVAVVTPYYPPNLGGVEQYAYRQVLALREHPDFETVVITTGTSQKTMTAIEDGVAVIRLGRGVNISNTPLNPVWLWQLPRLLAEHDIDVVSAHAPVPGLADLALRTAGHRPVVLTYHSGSLVKGNTGPMGRAVDVLLIVYERWLLTHGFSRAACLVGVSPASLAMNHGASMITPGVDTELFVPGPSPVGSPKLLYVGRIERASAWKGIDVLIRAFAEVRRSVPEAELHLVGAGDAVEELQDLAARLSVTDGISWHGALDHSALVSHYQQACALVLPSLTEAESFGMTLIEALACARPVIASNVGGIPFVVRPDIDGLLVPPGDVFALAAACLKLINEPGLAARFGRAGRHAVEERFSWKAITAEMITVLKEAAGQPMRSSAGSR